jgi:hypothetical protein
LIVIEAWPMNLPTLSTVIPEESTALLGQGFWDRIALPALARR